MKIEVHGAYLVELCGGERCIWEYLGEDDRAILWWCDLSSGRKFTENCLMYAWQVLGAVPAKLTNSLKSASGQPSCTRHDAGMLPRAGLIN